MRKHTPPTPEQIRAAESKTVRDVIRPGLKILFCGINPGLYSAAVGHHFARPGNRFWKALFGAGLTPRLLSAYEDRLLLQYGYGVTNLVGRATAAARDIRFQELKSGKSALLKKIQKYSPGILVVLGIGVYRQAFDQPHAKIGMQADPIGSTRVWVLPNPSGLNANYKLSDLIRLFKKLKHTAVAKVPRGQAIS
jgi:TDG/mug DNA glycosylase family protein